jgi:hypothetical protein
MRRKPKATRRRSRTRIIDDLAADAMRHVADAWSRAEFEGALTDGSDQDPEHASAFAHHSSQRELRRDRPLARRFAGSLRLVSP